MSVKTYDKYTKNKIAWLLVLAVLILTILACEPTLEATRTPPVQVGSTVFAAIYWRSSESAIDVVFVPDTSFGEMGNLTNRQNFYDDVAALIGNGFYQNNAVVNNISLFNFWYMHTPGTVSPPASSTDICPILTWPNLTDAAFAEMVIIVHRNSAIRDCGGNGRASAQAGGGNEWIVVHEGGHAGFALPDEYCCDGGYKHAPPILYNSKSSCENDAANSAWRNCQSFTAKNGDVWWRSEDKTSDLMSDGGPPVLEVGQADWVLMRNVLGALPGVSVNDPTVFAPNAWDWP